MHVDELGLPTVPEPKPEDLEDVSWALSTAEAMWARGDHNDAIKWVRRAAEAASEAEDDRRSLELAKAAADLTGLIAKRTSRASIDIEEVVPMSDPVPAPPPPVPPKKAPSPIVNRMHPTSVTKQVTTPSRPPAPLPSKTSSPPAALGKAKPLGTNTKPPSMKPPASKKGRRSRENLDAEAKAAAAMIGNNANAGDTSPQAAMPAMPAMPLLPDLPADTAETAAIEVPFRVGRELGNNDPTFVGTVSEIQARERPKSAEEWDSDSTQNLTGDDLPFPTGPGGGFQERKTAVGAPPDFKSTMQSLPKSSPRPAPKTPGASGAPASGPGTNPPATVVGSMQSLVSGVNAGSSMASASPRAAHVVDDPQIMTSQAVRVVVWRDATGVHVAPAGTVVSAITVDAVLVALEPNADLTAWLTQKGR